MLEHESQVHQSEIEYEVEVCEHLLDVFSDLFVDLITLSYQVFDLVFVVQSEYLLSDLAKFVHLRAVLLKLRNSDLVVNRGSCYENQLKNPHSLDLGVHRILENFKQPL